MQILTPVKSTKVQTLTPDGVFPPLFLAGVGTQQEQAHALLMLASYGEAPSDGNGNIKVFRFMRGFYNPYMRASVGFFQLSHQLPCSNPTGSLAVLALLVQKCKY